MNLRTRSTSTAIPIQRVIPAIPQDPEDRRTLERHLEVMGCQGLLDVAWGVKEEALVTELMGAPGNQYDGSLRAHPEKWGVPEWRATYGFRAGAVKVAERRDEFLAVEFTKLANPKDGYTIDNLCDPEAQLVIGFLNPIFHPEKPKRVVSKWAATFLGAMRKRITVDWAELMRDMTDRMVKDLRKVKKAGTPLPSYLIHLYAHHELLLPQEQDMYDDLLSIQKYGGPESDSEKEEPDAPEVQAAPAPPPVGSPRTRKRSRSVQRDPEPEVAGYHLPEGVKARPDAAGPSTGPSRICQPHNPNLTGDVAEDVMELLTHVAWRSALMNQEIADREVFINQIREEVGVQELSEVIPVIKGMKNVSTRLRVMEEQQAFLAGAMETLRRQLEDTNRDRAQAEEARRVAEEKAKASALALAEIRKVLDFPVDTIHRSLLFTERLETEGKLNRGQIIRFLNDHGRKMEKTWGQMRELVANLAPEGPEERSTQAPEDLVTPVRVTTTPEPVAPQQATPETSGGAVNPEKTPATGSPMSWSAFPTLSTGTLRQFQDGLPEGSAFRSPPAFRLPSISPSGSNRKTTSPLSRRLNPDLSSPPGSFRDMIDSQIREAGKTPASPPVVPRSPSPEAAASPEAPETVREAGESSRRRSGRLKGIQISP